MANTTIHGWALIGLFIVLTFAMAKPVGAWLFALYEGRAPKYLVFFAPVERGIYRAAGIDPDKEQGWRAYCVHMLLFSVAGIFLTYAMERLQFSLPLNPQGFAEGGSAFGHSCVVELASYSLFSLTGTAFAWSLLARRVS